MGKAVPMNAIAATPAMIVKDLLLLFLSILFQNVETFQAKNVDLLPKHLHSFDVISRN